MFRNILCRLHLKHAWHAETTGDGARFLRCTRCGRDRFPGEKWDPMGTSAGMGGFSGG